jgi:two-component system CheB/CheR fusion protein
LKNPVKALKFGAALHGFTGMTKQHKNAIESKRKEVLHDAEMIVESVRQPLIVLDDQHRVATANPAFYRAFRVKPPETIGHRLYDLGNGQWDIPELHRLLEEILPENQAFDDFRVEHEFESIGRRVMMINARRLDHIQMILLAIEDVTDQERAKSEVRFAELNHRLKNTIAAVQALASLTMQNSTSFDEFRQSFEGRLNALAKVQELLITGDSEGVPLRAMFEKEFEPFCAPPDSTHKCTFEGPDLSLSPEAAQSFQLVLHELTTNAAKYGALSTPPLGVGGRIEIRWRLVPTANGAGATPPGDAEHFNLEINWIESGGPPPSFPPFPPSAPKPPSPHKASATSPAPGPRGFGLKLIQSLINYELGGEVTMDFGKSGFSCSITLPWTSDGIQFRQRQSGAHVISKDVKYDSAGQPLPHDHSRSH